MPVTAPVSLSKIVAEFGGNGRLASYYRGGPYVPNIPANSNISTTAAGLRLSQFLGATNAITLSVTASPNLVYATSTAPGMINSGTVVLIAGGTPPYTYTGTWEVGGGGLNIGRTPNGFMISGSSSPPSTREGMVRISATDSLGATGVGFFDVVFNWLA